MSADSMHTTSQVSGKSDELASCPANGRLSRKGRSAPEIQHGAARRRRVCFVSSNLYPVLKATGIPFIGGAELQQVILARSLRDSGHDVSFVTNVFDGEREDECIEDMVVHKAFDPQQGIPLARFFYPRLTQLWMALKRADAEIYYQRCADKTTGICAAFCRKYGRKFVYSGAHDTDFDSRPPLRYPDRALFAWGLGHADRIVAQTESQQQALESNYGLPSKVLPNVYPRRELTSADGYVLWVGNMREFKRPAICLEVARRHPDQRFIMIGGPGSDGQQRMNEVLKTHPPNVEVLGFQPFEATERYFDGANVLLNTSSAEGFPNTYLQAWARGIPIVGTFDPGGRVRNHELGKICDNVESLSESLPEWLDLAGRSRRRIQSYFEKHFSPQEYIDRLFDFLDQPDYSKETEHGMLARLPDGEEKHT